MKTAHAVFVGRREELARGALAAERALAGDGGVLLLSGEAGIGKTRLAQAIAAEAGARGAKVVWGRVWEAGGAPAYWPWIQVFRALGATEDPLSVGGPADSLAGPQARFSRFERAARWLEAAASEVGLAIVLDDLHAADLPSLHFLHFLSREKGDARLLLLGTYREVEARMERDVDALLAKVAREGDVIMLDRLAESDVLAWLRATSGPADEGLEDDAAHVHRVTEGNALFVHELLRVRASTNLVDPARAPRLRAILDEHFARVSSETRELLVTASVLGRELEHGLVATISGRARDDVDRALREAEASGILISVAGGVRYAFSHILLRDRLYAELPPSRRAALHGAVAEALAEGEGALATAVHHLFASDATGPTVAARALEAARAALEGLAFEEAASLCARALEKHTADDALTADLDGALGEALMRAGKVSDGREVCVRAARRAQRIRCAPAQASAALAYGIEIVTGARDVTMLELLHDALEALPPGDSPLRARVLARYAAALVPPRSLDEADFAVATGADAVAMARRVGDLDTLLYALHFGGSAAGYLVPAEQRRAYGRELYTLARSSGRVHVLLGIIGWWCSLLREFGEIEESERALAAYGELLRDFPQAYYRWRIGMTRATYEALSGDFDLALQLGDAALAEAEIDGPVAAARAAWSLLRIGVAHLRDDMRSVASAAARIEAVATGVLGAAGFMTLLYAATDRPEAAGAGLDAVAGVDGSFPSCLAAGEAVCRLGDRARAEALYPRLCAHAAKNTLFWGPFGATVFGPVQRVAGDVALLLGRTEEARRWFEEARLVGERMQAAAIVDLAKRRLAALPGARPPSSGRERPRTTGPRATIELVRDGEMWLVSASGAVRFHLKDAKGLHYLSQLLSRPGEALHVTELAQVTDVSTDAGAALDARAKADYRERVAWLREELAEAERFGDPARTERARAELDMIADALAGAVGLGGRDRRLGSHAERVRINVQRRIRDAIVRIEQHDPSLGRYLAATVKTGTFCVFSPI